MKQHSIYVLCSSFLLGVVLAVGSVALSTSHTANAANANLVSEGLTLSTSGQYEVGKAISVNASVRNIGIGSTDVGFSDQFSYQWNSTAGVWQSITTIARTALGEGISMVDGPISFVPGQTGTLYIRHCVDSGNAVNEGLDEAPNCSTSAGVSVSAPGTRGAIVVTSNVPTTWTLTGPGTIMGSGTSTTYASELTGAYTITWGSVAGYNTPAVSSQTLTAGGSVTYTANYTFSNFTPPAPVITWGGDPGICGGRLSLGWDIVPGAVQSYRVYRDSMTNYVILSNMTNRYDLQGLTPGQAYTFYVQAVGTSPSPLSAPRTFTASAACGTKPDIDTRNTPEADLTGVPPGQSVSLGTSLFSNYGGSDTGPFAISPFEIDVNGDGVGDYTSATPSPVTNLTPYQQDWRSVSWTVPLAVPLGSVVRFRYRADPANQVAEGNETDNLSAWSNPFWVTYDPTIRNYWISGENNGTGVSAAHEGEMIVQPNTPLMLAMHINNADQCTEVSGTGLVTGGVTSKYFFYVNAPATYGTSDIFKVRCTKAGRPSIEPWVKVTTPPASTSTCVACTNLTSYNAPTILDQTPKKGEWVSFRGRTYNTGTTNVGAFTNAFWYRWGSSGAWTKIGSSISKVGLASGAQDTDTSESVLLSQTGSFYVKHCADHEPKAITETDESDADNCKIGAFSIAPPVVPPTPPNFVVETSANCGGKVNLRWDQVDGATYYLVYRDAQAPINVGNVSAYTWASGTPNQSYTFRVRAYNSDSGASDYTPARTVAASAACTPQILSFQICGPSGQCTNAPATPLTVAPGSALTITWSAIAETCNGVTPAGFNTGGNITGTQVLSASALPNQSVLYQLSCLYPSGTPVTRTLTVSTTGAVVPPELTVNTPVVTAGETVRLSWDANNGNETLCTLSGPGLGANPLGNGTGNAETGHVDITVSNRSTYRLTCTGLSSVKTIEIKPIGSEQ